MGRIQGDLLDRSFEFAVSIMSLVDELPDNNKGWVITRQIVRSGTSVGANIHEADHALTSADFAHKCSIARKEASEVCYWLKLCRRTNLLNGKRLESVINEADELIRILSSVVKNTQERMN